MAVSMTADRWMMRRSMMAVATLVTIVVGMTEVLPRGEYFGFPRLVEYWSGDCVGDPARSAISLRLVIHVVPEIVISQDRETRKMKIIKGAVVGVLMAASASLHADFTLYRDNADYGRLDAQPDEDGWSLQ